MAGRDSGALGLQRLKQLAEVRGGLTLGKQYSGDLLEYPYLRVANVQDGYLDLEDVLTVEVPASEADHRTFWQRAMC